MKQIKAQIFLMMKRKSFAVSLSALLFLSIVSFLWNCVVYYGADIVTVPAAKYEYIGSDFCYAFFQIFALIYPLFVVLPFADTFFEERSCGMVEYCVSRISNRRYYSSKWIAVFLSGMLVTFVPLGINLLLNFIAFPLDSMNTSTNLPVPLSHLFTTVIKTGLFPTWFAKNMYVYHFIYLLLCTVAGGLIAVVVFQFSFFYNKSRILLLGLFFLIYHVYTIILNRFGTSEFCIENYIYSSRFFCGQSIRGMTVSFSCLLLAALLPIPFARKKMEEFCV